MQEWKEIVAIMSIMVIIASMVLPLVMFGPMLDDPEFDEALVWAADVGIPDIETIQEYPFSPIPRKEAVAWYVAAAPELDLIVYSDDLCEFSDIEALDQTLQDQIELACRYRFFLGNGGNFVPDGYLTKASSLVALIRGIYPAKAFPEVDPYREPFVNTAYSMGITKRPSSPYMMYLVTKYELLLQLYRAAKPKA